MSASNKDLSLMGGFQEKLRLLLKEQKIGRKKLAKDLEIAPLAIGQWLTGKNCPSYISLVKLTEVLHCSADYLCGLSDRNVYRVKPCGKNFSEIFDELLKKNKTTKSRFSEETGIGLPNVSTWYYRGSLPVASVLIKISKFFNCSVDCLLLNVDEQKRQTESADKKAPSQGLSTFLTEVAEA